MRQGSFFATPARSPVPESSSPGLRFLSQPPFPPKPHSPRTLGSFHTWSFLTLSTACRGHVMASRQEGQRRKTDRGLCPQLPLHTRVGGQGSPPAAQLRAGEGELSLQPSGGWARRSRPHLSQRAWRKASRIDLPSNSVQRHIPDHSQPCLGCSVPKESLAPSQWLEPGCSLPMPSEVQHTPGVQRRSSDHPGQPDTQRLCPGPQYLLARSQEAVVAQGTVRPLSVGTG